MLGTVVGAAAVVIVLIPTIGEHQASDNTPFTYQE